MMYMQRLMEDHRNFARVLGLLQRQRNELDRDEGPDYYLLLKIVEYFEEYPSRCHHPLEDMLFSIYLQRNTEGSEAIKALMKEHIELESITRSLRKSTEAVLLDGIVDRVRFIEQLDGFLQRQRDHLAVEEVKVFPLIRRKLTEEDWKTVKAQLSLRDYPVTGPQVLKKYASLYQRISC